MVLVGPLPAPDTNYVCKSWHYGRAASFLIPQQWCIHQLKTFSSAITMRQCLSQQTLVTLIQALVITIDLE